MSEEKKPTDVEKKSGPKPQGLTIESLFQALAMQQAAQQSIQNIAKPMDQYKFWKTQPVPKFDTAVDKEGPIENKTVDQVEKDPQPLLAGFKWSNIDMNKEEEVREVYDLLYHNYIEDADESFRFKYSPEFLDWALKPPGWNPDWHIGVRAKESGKLVAFISGIPATIKVRDGKPVKVAEINFMCVHKKLRSKRLAPVLIREVTRRVNLTDVWQALYTGGVMLPSPISTCRYYHRSINWTTLYEVGFSPLPPGSTPAQQVAKYALPNEKTMQNLRPMEAKDVPQVKVLLDEFLKRFDVVPVMDEEELKHWLLNGKNVVYAYVVEQDGKITDFVSFYGLESSVLGNPDHDVLRTAYAFYYATDAGIGENFSEKKLKARLQSLFQNALIFAKQLNYDVFNALTLQDNPSFLEDLNFGAGDGYLHYYLFNYQAFPIHGGINNNRELDYKPGTGVGVVML